MASLGEELKRERELREISLREISQATKISMRILEAIEKNNYKILPGGIFNRNFIRAYAEFIGVDAETAVNKYYQQSAAVAVEEALPAAIKTTPAAASIEPIQLRTWMLYGLVGLVLLSLLFFGIYRLRKSASTSGAAQPPRETTRLTRVL
jgi:cytoskeletal protein RodZ